MAHIAHSHENGNFHSIIGISDRKEVEVADKFKRKWTQAIFACVKKKINKSLTVDFGEFSCIRFEQISLMCVFN